MSANAHQRPSRLSHVTTLLLALLLAAATLAAPTPATAKTPRTVRVSTPQQVAAVQAQAATASVREDKVSAVAGLLRAGVARHQTTMDVSSVGATKAEAEEAITEVMYDPAIYTLSSQYSYSYSTNVETITLAYAVDVSDLDSWEAKVEEKVQDALSWMDDTMSDAQKAQALHDYLVRNCAYDQTASSNDELPFTALGALVEGSAVCQGYSDAYSLLLSRVGIDSEYVSSSAMNHGWSLVQIDGAWYHVDVTWDDPIVNNSDQGPEAAVSHEFFLKGDSTMRSGQQSHHDWVAKHTAPSDYEMSYATYAGPLSSPSYDLSNATITIDGDTTYTGSPIGGDIVKVSYRGQELVEDTDYSLSFSDNTNVGTATVTATGKGSYHGTKTQTFQIGPADISTANVLLINNSHTYDGEAFEPEPYYVMVGGNFLDEGTDYTVSYANNVDAGEGTMELRGIGNYTGELTGTFDILPADISGATVSVENQTWTGSSLTPSPTVALGEWTLVAGTDYDVSYSNNTDAGTATVTVTGRGNYQGSATATFEITRKEIPASSPRSATRAMHRLYNPNSGEHFYTASAAECDHLVGVGWSYEGVGWTAPASSSTPVFRLYSGTDHHYTTSAAERDHLVSVGWSYEGVGWYSDDARGVALYRQFNPNVDPSAPTNNSGSHNYTTSRAENNHLVSVGWRAEGVGWYGVR